jgi:hypothetical protein
MRLRLRPHKNLVQVLNELVAIESAETGRYEAALARRFGGAETMELTRLRNEHRRHAAHLKLFIHTWGGPLPPPPSWCFLRQQGRRALAGLLGDRALLELMKREEEQVTRAYLAALSRPLPERVRRGLESALREQLLHGGWYEAALEQKRLRKSAASAGVAGDGDGGPEHRAA